jgi:hypothetical protein
VYDLYELPYRWLSETSTTAQIGGGSFAAGVSIARVAWLAAGNMT